MTTFCYDLETTGLDFDSELIGCGYTCGDEIKFDRTATKEWVREQIAKSTEVIGHNLKYDLQIVGNPPTESIFDTMVAEWLLYPDQHKLSLKYLGDKYFGEKNPTYKELLNQYKPKKMKLKEATLDVVPQDVVDTYAKKDVELTWKLHQIHKDKLKETGLDKLFYDLEMPFLKILAEMELNGIKFDVTLLEEMRTKADARVIELRKLIREVSGVDFKLDSPKQLADVIYGKLGLPRLSQNTAYSTGENVLSRLADKHPIIPLLLEYRKLTKMLRTYLYALPTHVKKDGRIHPSFRQTGTGTGRLSCDNPNLQNIPKTGEAGGEIRKAFIPEEGNIFIIGDYDQMELRMLAHISNDREMIHAFRSGVDIHKSTAQQIFGKEDITDDERRMAKTINFGIIYGQTASGLAKALEKDYITARNFIYKYACTYSEAWSWRKIQISLSQKLPVVETILGRKRDLNAVSGIADRMALNTPIQGSCADLVKVAMIRCVKELKKKNLKSRLVLQVHDELIFEVPLEEKDTAKEIIQGCMDSINCLNDVILNCPMKVSIDERTSWLKEEK